MIKKIKETIRMIMVDVDGTLLDNYHNMSEANQKTLSGLSEQKIYLVMNTGALPKDGYNVLTNTSIGIDNYTKWFIGLNGIVIYNFLTNDSYFQINTQNKTKIKEVFEKLNFKNYEIINLQNRSFLHFIVHNFETWYKLVFEIYLSLEKNNNKILGLESCLLLINHFDQVSLAKKNIIYFGDNLNDLLVFSDPEVYCIAMKNAIDEVKTLANDSTTDNYQGISDYLEKLKSAN